MTTGTKLMLITIACMVILAGQVTLFFATCEKVAELKGVRANIEKKLTEHIELEFKDLPKKEQATVKFEGNVKLLKQVRINKQVSCLFVEEGK